MVDIKEFIEKVVQINRVSKKTKGGNRISFSVLVVVGDKKGRVGVGLGKAVEPRDAIQKAVRYAKKHLITVPMVAGTITHDIYVKLGAAKVILRRAPEGTGVIAGGAVRAVVEAAGVRNIVSKVLGTSNKASNVYATIVALKKLKPRSENGRPVRLASESVAGRQETGDRKSEKETIKENISEKVKVEKAKEEVKVEKPQEVKVEQKQPTDVNKVLTGKRGRKPASLTETEK